MAGSILVVDLDRHASETLRSILEQAGAWVRVAYDPSELSCLDASSGFSVVMLDTRFPRVDNADPLEYLKVKAPEAVFVALAPAPPDEKALEALRRRGVGEALVKPYDSSRVMETLERARKEIEGREFDFPGMIGRSAPMLKLYDSIRSVARTDSSALIYGETGSGKELIASAIHKLSRRRNRKFVTINCGALSESLLESELFGHERGAFTGAAGAKMGKFESADEGTVFLDEIGEISPAAQVKLLKVIETGEVERLGSNRVIKTDTRMIFATNRDLAADVESGRFRRDLYYRINTFPIRAPSLRERKDDIPALAGHFLSVYSLRHGRKMKNLSPEVIRWLLAREWMGNVRELESVIERAVILAGGDEITVAGLDACVPPDAPDEDLSDLSGLTHREMKRKVMSVYESRYLTRLLSDCGGNMALAARRAGLDRKTLYAKLAEHGIEPSGFRGGRRG